MIQIQSAEQFTKAAERMRKERMHVRRAEQSLYEVVNKAKGHVYYVRFTRLNAQTFGSCTCKAGNPGNHRRPVVCKHLCATILFVRALREMRRREGH
jgi:uncharacterized Zn finger protein